jgi:hypothetical protein
MFARSCWSLCTVSCGSLRRAHARPVAQPIAIYPWRMVFRPCTEPCGLPKSTAVLRNNILEGHRSLHQVHAHRIAAPRPHGASAPGPRKHPMKYTACPTDAKCRSKTRITAWYGRCKPRCSPFCAFEFRTQRMPYHHPNNHPLLALAVPNLDRYHKAYFFHGFAPVSRLRSPNS